LIIDVARKGREMAIDAVVEHCKDNDDEVERTHRSIYTARELSVMIECDQLKNDHPDWFVG